MRIERFFILALSHRNDWDGLNVPVANFDRLLAAIFGEQISGPDSGPRSEQRQPMKAPHNAVKTESKKQ
jgi:hypothetical protein